MGGGKKKRYIRRFRPQVQSCQRTGGDEPDFFIAALQTVGAPETESQSAAVFVLGGFGRMQKGGGVRYIQPRVSRSVNVWFLQEGCV